MRVPIYTVVLPIFASAAAVAFAQDPPPVPPKQPTESAAPSKAGSSSQGQSDRMAGPASERLPEMKTQTYSGTLMDASCAGSGSAATPSASSTSSTISSPGQTASTSSADRSAGPSSPSCAVSASTAQFAMKMKDGNTVRFDDVGNTRVQEAMKTHKAWSDAASAGKPLHVKASGVLNGDKLTVLSVH